MTKDGTRGRFSSVWGSFEFFLFCGFFGFRRLAAGQKIAKRFVSEGFASGGVFGPPYLVPKKWPSKFAKNLAPKKRCIFFFELSFGPFLPHFFFFRGGFS